MGPAPALAFDSIAGFTMTGEWALERRAALEVRYELVPGLVGGSVLDAFDAVDLIASVDTTTSITYPAGELAGALKDAAALIKANIGIKVIAINIGGWDHHTNLLVNLATLGGELSASLKAFHDDLGTDLGRTLTLVMTEFGRRIDENGGDGTDHGHGGVMIALGRDALSGPVRVSGPRLTRSRRAAAPGPRARSTAARGAAPARPGAGGARRSAPRRGWSRT